MIHKGNKILDGYMLYELFHTWDIVSGEGHKEGEYYISSRTVSNDNNTISVYTKNGKPHYWSVNDGKKHTQFRIVDFLRICKNKYGINFKLKHIYRR